MACVRLEKRQQAKNQSQKQLKIYIPTRQAIAVRYFEYRQRPLILQRNESRSYFQETLSCRANFIHQWVLKVQIQLENVRNSTRDGSGSSNMYHCMQQARKLLAYIHRYKLQLLRVTINAWHINCMKWWYSTRHNSKTTATACHEDAVTGFCCRKDKSLLPLQRVLPASSIKARQRRRDK